MWCLCNNSQWMTINTTKQVFYLSGCEAAKTAPLRRADPPRQAVPCILMKIAPRRGLLGKVLYSILRDVGPSFDVAVLFYNPIFDWSYAVNARCLLNLLDMLTQDKPKLTPSAYDCDLPYTDNNFHKDLQEYRITALMQDLWSSIRVVQSWANYQYMCTSATAVLIDLSNTLEAKMFICVWVIILCYQAVKTRPKYIMWKTHCWSNCTANNTYDMFKQHKTNTEGVQGRLNPHNSKSA